MRACELLQESGYVNELQTEVNNLLTMLKANDIYEIKLDILVARLDGMGYSVSSGSLLSMLQGNPIVDHIDGDTVAMQNPEDNLMGDEAKSAEENQKAVAQMAQNAASKDM